MRSVKVKNEGSFDINFTYVFDVTKEENNNK